MLQRQAPSAAATPAAAPRREARGGGREGGQGAKRDAAPPPRRGRGDSPERLATADLERQIERLETRLREIDQELLDPAVFGDPRRSRELGEQRQRTAAELEPLEFEWSRRAGE